MSFLSVFGLFQHLIFQLPAPYTCLTTYKARIENKLFQSKREPGFWPLLVAIGIFNLIVCVKNLFCMGNNLLRISIMAH